MTIPDRLDRDRAVLVVVDIQDRFRDLIFRMDQVLDRTGRLIQFCRALDIPILVTEHYSKGLGATVPELASLLDPIDPIQKIHFSCWGSDEFRRQFQALGRDQVILTGIETHVCIYQTARDLLKNGCDVALASDAISSCSKANYKLGLSRLREIGAQGLGTQMLMFDLLERAGTEEFKQVAKLLQD